MSDVLEITFDSSNAASVARQTIANDINAAIAAGTIYVPPFNTAPPLPSGDSVGLFVITSASSGEVFTLPTGYTDVVDLATAPITIVGSGGSSPYEILAGTGGLTFYASDSLGGSIAAGGGANTIAGGSSLTGLQGDWLVDVGSGNVAD